MDRVLAGILAWLNEHEPWLWWVGGISALLMVGTLAVIPLLIVRMRSDYFLHHAPAPDTWRGQHPVVRLTLLVLKNAVGAAFVIAGLAMLLLPGQGILTILIGVTLLNFPGKRALELRIVRQRPVLGAINWIRARARRPPLRLPHPEGARRRRRAKKRMRRRLRR